MEIKVFGSGCAKCSSLEKATRKAVEELNIDVEIVKVQDIQKIMQAGVIQTPALMVNNKIVVTGKVPKVSQLKEVITQNM